MKEDENNGRVCCPLSIWLFCGNQHVKVTSGQAASHRKDSSFQFRLFHHSRATAFTLDSSCHPNLWCFASSRLPKGCGSSDVSSKLEDVRNNRGRTSNQHVSLRLRKLPKALSRRNCTRMHSNQKGSCSKYDCFAHWFPIYQDKRNTEKNLVLWERGLETRSERTRSERLMKPQKAWRERIGGTSNSLAAAWFSVVLPFHLSKHPLFRQKTFILAILLSCRFLPFCTVSGLDTLVCASLAVPQDQLADGVVRFYGCSKGLAEIVAEHEPYSRLSHGSFWTVCNLQLLAQPTLGHKFQTENLVSSPKLCNPSVKKPLMNISTYFNSPRWSRYWHPRW